MSDDEDAQFNATVAADDPHRQNTDPAELSVPISDGGPAPPAGSSQHKAEHTPEAPPLTPTGGILRRPESPAADPLQQQGHSGRARSLSQGSRGSRKCVSFSEKDDVKAPPPPEPGQNIELWGIPEGQPGSQHNGKRAVVVGRADEAGCWVVKVERVPDEIVVKVAQIAIAEELCYFQVRMEGAADRLVRLRVSRPIRSLLKTGQEEGELFWNGVRIEPGRTPESYDMPCSPQDPVILVLDLPDASPPTLPQGAKVTDRGKARAEAALAAARAKQQQKQQQQKEEAAPAQRTVRAGSAKSATSQQGRAVPAAADPPAAETRGKDAGSSEPKGKGVLGKLKNKLFSKDKPSKHADPQK